MIKKYLFIVIFVILSCENKSILLNYKNIEKIATSIDCDYYVLKYMDEIKENSLVSARYFNTNNQLIEELAGENRIKYIYDANDKLIQKKYCRFQNGNTSYRQVLVYDEHDNYIGSYFKRDTITDSDSIAFDTVKFYNNQQHLVRELIQTGTNVSGKKHEHWKEYVYQNDTIRHEIELINKDTVWLGSYQYDKRGNLIEIHKEKNTRFETIEYTYNQLNQLVNKKITGNKYPIDNYTVFTVSKNSVVYKYDIYGRLQSEIIYNHKGEIYRKFLYRYQTKNQ